MTWKVSKGIKHQHNNKQWFVLNNSLLEMSYFFNTKYMEMVTLIVWTSENVSGICASVIVFEVTRQMNIIIVLRNTLRHLDCSAKTIIG